MNPAISEENRLLDLLRDFNLNLTLDYLNKVRELSGQLWGVNAEPIYHKGIADPIAYRLKFDKSLFLALSHPLCRMHLQVHYPIEYEWERFYVAHLGILPVYLLSLNVITLVKLWGEESMLSTDAISTMAEKEEIFLEMRPRTRSICFSTMNFIIPFGADLFKAPKEIEDLMQRYFKYSLWTDIRRGFSFCTHFLHDRNSIKFIIKPAKTLCLIEDVGRSRRFDILGRTIKAYRTNVRVLTRGRSGLFFKRLRVYLPQDVAEELRVREDLSKTFLNAVVLELKQKRRSFELLSVLSDIGASSYELTQTIISYAIMSRFYKGDYTTYVCELGELKDDFRRIMNQIGRHFNLPITVSDYISNLFDLSLRSHSPMFLADDEKIYYMHPLILGYLYSKGLTNLLKQEETRRKLLVIIKFLERIRSEVPYISLYLDEALDIIARSTNESKRELLSEIASLKWEIKASKLLRKCF